MHLPERAGGDGEVLAESGNSAPGNIPGSDHDAVGGKVLVLDSARLAGAVDVHANFLESTFLEQRGETFTRRHLTLFVTGADLFLAAGCEDLGLPVP